MKGKTIFIKVSMFILAIMLVAGCGKKDFTVTFDSANSTKSTTQIVEKDKQASKPSNPTKEGYEFIGWFIGDEEYDFSKPIDKDVTITAKWKKIDVDVKSYTVMFNTDGGNNIASIKVNENTAISKPSNPTKEGYTFAYWKLNDKEYDFNSKVSSDITLIAVWTKNDQPASKPTNPTTPTNPTNPTNPKPVKYTVTFDAAGGSNVASQSVESGKTVGNPGNPSRSGYKFLGWTLNGNNYNFSTAITGNITLVAKWEKIITYTFKVENVDNFTPSRKVYVYKDGVNITKEAGAIRTSDGTILGLYKEETGAIMIDQSQVKSIGSIKLNGTLIKF